MVINIYLYVNCKTSFYYDLNLNFYISFKANKMNFFKKWNLLKVKINIQLYNIIQ